MESAHPTKADDAHLKQELRERDGLYLAAYRHGYVNLPLHPLLDREWDVHAAWLSGRDWAARDRHPRWHKLVDILHRM